MNKHTPGPWKMDKWNTVKDIVGNTILVEGLALSGRTNHESLANTRLIAAAPDLLEALLDMVSAMESYGYPHSPEIATARAAIAKATGESQ